MKSETHPTPSELPTLVIARAGVPSIAAGSHAGEAHCVMRFL